MDEIYYFPAREEDKTMWPAKINNSVYKVFSYSSKSDKIKTVARGVTVEDAGEELFQNIYQRTFPEGKITNEFIKNPEEIKQETSNEYGVKRSLDSKIIPLNNKEFEEFQKVRKKYSYNQFYK